MRPISSLAAVAASVLAACASFDAMRGAAPASDPIARYVDWRGGEAWLNAETVVLSGEIATSGLAGEIVSQQVRASRSRTDLDLVVVSVTQTIDGDGGWAISPGGQVGDLGEDAVVDGRRGLELSFGTVFVEDTDGEVSVLEPEERDGATWDVIRIAYPNGDWNDLFVAFDGALGWSRVHADTDTYWIEYVEWTTVDGVRMPARTEERHDGGDGDSDVTWTNVALNTPIDDATFERPTVADRVAFADGGASTGWIPFEFYRDQRLYLPATINGVETQAILDSGAELTAIDDDVARAAGLVGSGAISAQGTGGVEQVQFATGVNLSVGGLELRDMTIAILDLDVLATRLLGRPIPVILGAEVFNELIVDIDYPNHRIAFHDPSAWTYNGDGVEVPAYVNNGTRVVEISVEGRESIRVGFDIGQGSPLTLYEAYANEIRLLDGRAASDELGGGVGGLTVDTITTIDAMTFGGFAFENVPTEVPRDAEGSFDTTRSQGNLGTDVFARFRMIVDYTHDRIILEPGPEVDAPFARNRSGVQLAAADEGGEIVHVASGSPAAEAGLAVGDKIARINGVGVDASYWFSDLWRWTQAEAGQAATLTLSDGREVTLTLRDYF